MSQAIDFSRHLEQIDVDSKIRASHDNLLLIKQSEHKQLEEKIDYSVKLLNDKIEGVERRIDGVEKRIDAKIDGVEKRIDAKIDGVEKRISDVEKPLKRKSTKFFQ